MKTDTKDRIIDFIDKNKKVRPPRPDINHKCIMLIDDAVGSGSTLNETALKLRQQNKNLFILGYAIVGSYKGFEVIKEI